MPDRMVKIKLPREPKPVSQAPLTVILVRHGQQQVDVANPDIDPPLSDLGWKQAERVARRLSGQRIHHLYASNLQRANDTARVIARFHPSTPVTVTADLQEVMNYHFADPPPPDHPDLPRIGTERAALDRVVAQIRRNHSPGERVLLVCHGNVIRTIMPLFGGRNPHESLLIDINHTAVSIMEVYASGNAVLRLGNCVAHLEDRMIT